MSDNTIYYCMRQHPDDMQGGLVILALDGEGKFCRAVYETNATYDKSHHPVQWRNLLGRTVEKAQKYLEPFLERAELRLSFEPVDEVTILETVAQRAAQDALTTERQLTRKSGLKTLFRNVLTVQVDSGL